MANERMNIPKRNKENIRVFVHRKHLPSSISHKSVSSQSNSMEHLTSIIEKNLNLNKKNSRNNKNIIVVNYKPVFVHSREQKPVPVDTKKSPSTPPNTRRGSRSIPNPNPSLNRQSTSMNIPDVEDPFTYIEMMYQQLFTEDGQLRSGTEPEVLANCVKQIVTQSRRNSIAPNIQQHKISSRRSSKRSSMDNTDNHHQQQLHAFLNSYYHQQKRTSTNPMTLHNFNSPLSIDDTDNEDLDTFSDLNSYRRTLRHSPPASIDEDITQTDSKLLSSSGYQSLKSSQTVISPTHPAPDSHYCPNCVHTPPSTSISLIQPVREMVMKYVNFILISKNILLVPLFIFLLHQRSIHIYK